MQWANFLSQFQFHIAHIFGKHNKIADALSHRQRMNTISIAYHNNELTTMVDEYAIDPNFTNVMFAITMGETQDPYKVSDGYLLHDNCLCINKNLREKVMMESHAPPYAGHCGIAATTQVKETYFFWPSLKTDVHDFVLQCMVCQKVKYDRGKSQGLLLLLPILEAS